MKLTEEQESVQQAISEGTNASIKAYAGSGKTTTVVQAIKQLPKSRKVALIYFNKAARKDAEKKLAGHDNVSVWTNHTVAFGTFGVRFDNAGRLLKSDKFKSKRYGAQDLADYFGIVDYRSDNGTRVVSANAIAAMASRTVNQFTGTTNRKITSWHIPQVPAYADIEHELEPIILRYAQRIWDAKCDPTGILPIRHDDYLKMWADSPQSWFFKKNTIILDEFQDTNPIMWEVFSKHHRASLYGIGDPYQAVYGFRGAQNYLDEIKNITDYGKCPKCGSYKYRASRDPKFTAHCYGCDYNHTEPINPIPCLDLHLTRTFRFGGEIVDEANKWLAYCGAELPLVGNDALSSVVLDYIDEPDAVLCRTNTGVILAAIQAVADGVTFSIGGGSDEVKALAEAALQLSQDIPTTHPDLIGFTSWADFGVAVNEDPAYSDLKILYALVETHGAQALIDLANQAKPEGEAQRHITTAHKVKGLEWPRVQIGADFAQQLDANGNIKFSMAEAYLAYVSVTRAQQQLGLGSLDGVIEALTGV